MKKGSFVLLAILLVFVLAGCKPKPAANLGPALLTVSGKIGVMNSGKTYALDQAYFDARSVEVQLDDPWMGDGITYKGVLVRDLAKDMKVKRDAIALRLVSTDGKAVDVSLADARRWDILLARWADGKELDTDSGGPVKIVFPSAARNAYPAKLWTWWLTAGEVR